MWFKTSIQYPTWCHLPLPSILGKGNSIVLRPPPSWGSLTCLEITLVKLHPASSFYVWTLYMEPRGPRRTCSESVGHWRIQFLLYCVLLLDAIAKLLSSNISRQEVCPKLRETRSSSENSLIMLNSALRQGAPEPSSACSWPHSGGARFLWVTVLSCSPLAQLWGHCIK